MSVALLGLASQKTTHTTKGKMKSKILHRVPSGCTQVRVEYVKDSITYVAIIERPVNGEHLNARMIVLRGVQPHQIKRVLPVQPAGPWRAPRQIGTHN